MSKEYRLPDPGEGVHEADIMDVSVQAGDTVSDGDVLFSIETDKAAIDVPSPFDGKVDDVRVVEGDRVEVGDVLLTYTEDKAGSAAASSEAEVSEDEAEPSEAEAESSEAGAESSEAGAPGSRRRSGSDGGAGRAAKPAAQRKGGPSTRGNGGTGNSGTGNGGTGNGRAGVPVPAAPSTRRLARELGVDLSSVDGSGPDGRVLAEDVERAAGRNAGEAGPASAQPRKVPAAGREQREALRGVRRATAQRMGDAWAHMPHVMHQERVDITELERFRRRHKARAEALGSKLTVTVLAVKAAVGALKAYPRFNASFDEDNQEIVYKQDYHIAIAVDTQDGLLAPVIRDADRKNVLEIGAEARRLAAGARDRKLGREELTGATFTLTNPGAIGGVSFTPLINPPQAAILGLGRADLSPVVSGHLDDSGSVEPRLILPVVLAFDHRLNDGADAARFVNHVARSLRDAESFALQL